MTYIAIRLEEKRRIRRALHPTMVGRRILMIGIGHGYWVQRASKNTVGWL